MEKTQATRFLLPMIADFDLSDKNPHVPKYWHYFWRNSFINCYLYDNNKPEYNNHIFLWYDFDNSFDYPIFERNLQFLPTYVDDYEYKGKAVYVFKVPKQFSEDYKKFKLGLYSRFSPTYKSRILKFFMLQHGENLIESILYRTDIVKKWTKKKGKTIDAAQGEYWDKPIFDKETIKV